MVVSPIIAASVALMYQLLKQGLICAVHVCTGTHCFWLPCAVRLHAHLSALVFSLTWNILFAVAQACFAFLALMVLRIDEKSEEWQGFDASRRWFKRFIFRRYETI